jgi:hypothetical protein
MTNTFSPSEAALSVFELAKRQPQFVLRYCIIYALVLMAVYALAGATGVGKAIQDYAALTTGRTPPSPERMLEALSPAGFGFVLLLAFGIVSGAITSAMALRKAVRDEDQGFFGLQFGKDEVNLLLATLVVGAVLFAANMLISLVGGIATGGQPRLLVFVMMIAVIVVGVVGMRLSQFGVLTINDGRVSVLASIEQTKGQTWRFIGAYLLWFIVSSIITLIAQSIAGIGAGAMGVKVSSGMPMSLGAFFTPGWLFYTLVYGLAAGFGSLGAICVGAYAWHQMRGDLPATKAPL